MAGMEDMLKRENVQIIEKVSDWEESVHVAVQPLVDQGYVKSDYIDGIISNAKEFGPYFVICPDLALLHARPEQGVIKQQLARANIFDRNKRNSLTDIFRCRVSSVS